MKRVLIIGYGVSGKGCSLLLERLGIPWTAVDKNPAVGVLADCPEFPLEEISQLILSPGVLPSHPLVQRARLLGIEVMGEMEFALRHTKNRCVGITGSNGKTTTALLVAHVLNHAGIKAKAVGNLGVALSSYLVSADPKEILIIELSSFQLETLREKKFEIAAYLNLTPNHLDRYSSMQEYAAAKANIQKCLITGSVLLISSQAWRDYGSTLLQGEVELFDQHEDSLAAILEEEYIQLPRQNRRAAERICTHFGVCKGQFAEAEKSFQKPPHRMEWVTEIDGVHYYNDSKATSIEAVLHAVSLFRGPLIVILGGVDKGAPYQPWIEPFRGKIKRLIAYGEAASKMQRELSSFYQFEKVVLLSEAVAKAKAIANRGDTVLLSPGCSSYDQFKDYEHRGDEYKQLLRSLS